MRENFQCGACQLFSSVEYTEKEFYWDCDYCGAHSLTSAPTDDNGNLISHTAAVEIGRQEAVE